MSGGEADRKLLEVSSKQQMYGLKFLPTQDSKGNNLKISPNHQGVVVYNVSLFVNINKIIPLSLNNVSLSINTLCVISCLQL